MEVIAPPFTLSHPQRRIWFAEMENPGSAVNHLCGWVADTGCQDADRLRAAINQVVANEDALRLRLIKQASSADGFAISQTVTPYQGLEIPLHTFASPGEFRAWAYRESLRPLDIYQDPLVRFALIRLAGQEELSYAIFIHHLITDGASVSLLQKKVAAALAGSPAPRSVAYSDFVRWEEDYLQSEQAVADQVYWSQRLAELPEPVRLAGFTPAGEDVLVRTFDVDPELCQALLATCGEWKTTLFKLFLAAFTVYVSKAARSRNFAVTMANHNRSRPEFLDVSGMFVSTLPLLCRLDMQKSFRDHLATLGADLNDVIKNHAHFPLEQMAADLRRQGQDLGQLLKLSLVGHPDRPGPVLGIFPGSTPGGLAVHVNPEGTAAQGRLNLFYSADGQLYGEADLLNLHQGMLQVLETALRYPERKLAELCILPASQRSLVESFQGRARSYDATHTLAQTFRARVAEYADLPALCGGTEEYSYGQLDRWSDELALALLAGRESLGGAWVGLCGFRGPSLIAGILAILKAGGAYLPLDPAYPGERLEFMLEDAGVDTVLCHAQLRGQFSGRRSVELTVRRSAQEAPPMPLPPSAGPDDVAYVIYTSGTTGRPKGVPIRQHQVQCMVQSFLELLPSGPGQRSLEFASLNFDASVASIFTALLSGSCLVVASEEERQDPRAFVELMLRQRITIAMLSPAFLAMVPDTPLPDLTHLTVGGESPDPSVLARWRERATLLNAYGPTECTVQSNAVRVEAETPVNDIGPMLTNVFGYVLDPDLQPLPIGVPGELYLAGPQLCSGYHQRPELTEERFVPNPFSAGKMYKTGDLVRWLANGHIQFIGRLDFQVKIRGHRVECGEVSAALANIAGVNSCYVMAKASGSTHRLVAYLTAEPGRDLSVEEVQRESARFLPHYMIPSAFLILDHLPMTPNGKVDRNRLPEPGRLDDAHHEYVAPSNQREQILCDLWARLLGVEKVGVRDDFFQIGGDSLSCMRMVAEAEKLGLALEIAQVRLTPTVRQLALDGGRSLALPALEVSSHATLPLPRNALMMTRQEQTMHAAGARLVQTPSIWRLRGPVDEVALGKAVDQLIARHQALHLRLEDGIMTRLQPPPTLARPDDRAACRFVLEREGEVLLLKMYTTHEVMDAWSLAGLVKELGQRYQAILAGTEIPVVAAFGLFDFAQWYEQLLQRAELQESRNHWVKSAQPKLELPQLAPDPDKPPYAGVTAGLPFEVDLRERFENVCRREKCTPFEGYFAAYNLLLARRNGFRQGRILTAAVTALRDHPDLQEVVGSLTNRLYFATPVAPQDGFAEVCAQARQQLELARRHCWWPAWQELDPQGQGFPDFFFHYVPPPGADTQPFPGLEISQDPPPPLTTWPLGLAFHVHDGPQPRVSILARAGFCRQADAESLLDDYLQLLQEVTAI